MIANRLTVTAIATGLAAFATPAAAINGQAGVASGHSLASSCAGTTFGIGFSPGYITGDGTATAQRACSVATSAAVGGTAVSSNSRSGNDNGLFANSATVVASLGTLHLSAANAGSSSNYFSGATGMGGWNDTVTSNFTGLWVFSLHVDGQLSVGGAYPASAYFNIQAFLNLQALSHYNTAAYSAFLAANGPLPANSDSYYGFDQSDNWAIQRTTADRIVLINQDVFFAVPVVAGVAFTLGIYSQIEAAESSYGALGAPHNNAAADFANTITWNGKGSLITGSGPTTNFTLTSGSGFNYNISAVPEPGAWAMLIAGFGVCGVAARRRARVAAA